MNDLVGIIRTEAELERALERAGRSSRSAASVVGVEGHRQYNPGWHLAIDLRNMLLRHASASPRRRWPATRAAAATPARTIPADPMARVLVGTAEPRLRHRRGGEVQC